MSQKENKPLWQLSVEELRGIIAEVVDDKLHSQLIQEQKQNTPQYVYGIKGIAQLFNCSIATANQIKHSGLIDDAIMQINRKIIVDAELALQILKRKGNFK